VTSGGRLFQRRYLRDAAYFVKPTTLLARMHEMRNIAVDDPEVWLSVSLSVSNAPAPCKNDCTDQGLVSGGVSWGPKKHHLRRRSRLLADSMRPSPNYFGHLLMLIC